jgi:hypothetical protein
MNKSVPLKGGNLACLCANGGKVMTLEVSTGRTVEEMRWNEGNENFAALGIHEVHTQLIYVYMYAFMYVRMLACMYAME